MYEIAELDLSGLIYDKKGASGIIEHFRGVCKGISKDEVRKLRIY